MKKYWTNGEFLASVTVLLLGLVFALFTSRFRITMRPDYPGPRLFPYIACFGLIVCGLGMVGQAILKIHRGEGVRYQTREGWIKILVSLVILLGYIIALQFLGFVAATLIFSFIMVSYFSYGKKFALFKKILFSVILTAGIYLTYVQLFGMNLPKGLL